MSTRLLPLAILTLAMLLAVACAAPRSVVTSGSFVMVTPTLAPFTHFIVNSARDPGDGVCDAQECTFREAIEAANRVPGNDVITFDIRDGWVIMPQSPLPPITEPVALQNNARFVEMDGSNAGPGADGLRIQTDRMIVSFFLIQHFDGNGIHILSGSHNSLWGNRILSNGGSGIAIAGPENVIGNSMQGLNPNIIGGNARHGVEIYGWLAVNNVIMGNIIGGHDLNGHAVPGNKQSGIFIDCYARGTTIGGRSTQTRLAQGNGIADNGEAGITVCGPDNIIRENSITGNRRTPIEVVTPTPLPRP